MNRTSFLRCCQSYLYSLPGLSTLSDTANYSYEVLLVEKKLSIEPCENSTAYNTDAHIDDRNERKSARSLGPAYFLPSRIMDADMDGDHDKKSDSDDADDKNFDPAMCHFGFFFCIQPNYQKKV